MYYLFTSSFLLAFMSKDTVYQERGVFFFFYVSSLPISV